MTYGMMIDAVLAFALMVVVPLALRLNRSSRDLVGMKMVAAGAGAATSFLFEEGFVAASLAAPWVLLATLRSINRIDVRRPTRLGDLATILPDLYLVVGGGWLVVSRYGARPLGLSHDIVDLTAVHFHYAGFVASTIMLALLDWLERNHPPAHAQGQVAFVAVVIATPITAAGITMWAPLGALGSVLFGLGLSTGSLLTVRFVVRSVSQRVKAMLVLSALSVPFSMLLAIAYATGQWMHTPAPSLPTMVWTHGLVNAVGFAFLGVAGWIRLASRTPAGPRPAESRAR